MKAIETLNSANAMRPLLKGAPSGSVRAPEDGRAAASQSEGAPSHEQTPEPPAFTDTATYVNYRVEKQSGTVITKVVKEKSGEIVRQIPPDESLKLAAHLREILEKVRKK